MHSGTGGSSGASSILATITTRSTVTTETTTVTTSASASASAVPSSPAIRSGSIEDVGGSSDDSGGGLEEDLPSTSVSSSDSSSPRGSSSASGSDSSSSDSSSGRADDELDAAIEARIPRYWQELEAICGANMAYRPCAAFPAHHFTSAARSSLEPWGGFRGAGRWHTLRLLSATAAGARKERGGDVWWASLRDASTGRRLPARVFDDGDGGYTVAFVALAPGNFTLTLRLFYSLCAGLLDPFPDWAAKLAEKGEEAHCYIGEKLEGAASLVIPDDGSFNQTAGGGAGAGPGTQGAAGNAGAVGTTAGGAAAAAAAGSALGTAAPPQLVAGAVRRSDRYVYRESGGLRLHPCCLPPPWRLAAGPEVRRFVMWGDSTFKRPMELFTALARQPCRMKVGGWLAGCVCGWVRAFPTSMHSGVTLICS